MQFTHFLFYIFHITRFQLAYPKLQTIKYIFFPQFLPSHLSPFDRRFWTFLPLGLRSLPTQWMPPGPVTRCDSKPFDDFLKVNSTASPSFRLRKPSMCNLLFKGTNWRFLSINMFVYVALMLWFNFAKDWNYDRYNGKRRNVLFLTKTLFSISFNS